MPRFVETVDGAFKGNHCREVKGCAEAVDLMRLSVAIETFLVFLSRRRADDRGIGRRFVRRFLQLVIDGVHTCEYIREKERENETELKGWTREKERAESQYR